MIREAAQQTLDLPGAGVALPGPLVDAGAIDGDEGELRSDETGVGDHQADGGHES